MTQRRVFAKAIAYGKDVLADTVLREVYACAAEKKEGQTAFNAAVVDFFKPPVVESIDVAHYTGHASDQIGIEAHDDVDMIGVRVVIKARPKHIGTRTTAFTMPG